MKTLNIQIGNVAFKHIEENGLKANDIKMVILGAGGPKALSLIGLDKVIFGDFLQRSTPKWLIGSSVGAWRALCAMKKQPYAAYDRFAELYQETEFDLNDIKNITYLTKQILNDIIGNEAASILNNDQFKLGIITTRCHGLLKSNNRKKLLAGLGKALLLNSIKRSHLKYCFERVVFQSDMNKIPIQFDLDTTVTKLDQNNLIDALLATVAIPGFFEPIVDPANAPKGIYRDGGIIDYHFAPPSQTNGIVLCVHYAAKIIPGWFDKFLPWRKLGKEDLKQTIIISPSEDFRNTLPYKKIPDRGDYKRLKNNERKKYWKFTVEASNALGNEFLEILNQNNILNYCK